MVGRTCRQIVSAESENLFWHAAALYAVRALNLAFGAARTPAARCARAFRHRTRRPADCGRSRRPAAARATLGVKTAQTRMRQQPPCDCTLGNSVSGLKFSTA